MDKGEALDVLAKIGFRSDDPVSAVGLARIGKYGRLGVINQASENAEARNHCAAIEITRYWRGYRCRKELKELFEKNDSNVTEKEPSPSEPIIQQLEPETSKLEPEISHQTESSVSPKVSPRDSINTEKQTASDTPTTGGDQTVETLPPTTSVDTTKDSSISYIQQKLSSDETDKTESKSGEPTSERTASSAKQPKVMAPFSRVQAATVIQKAWRRHIDMQVFRYYRDLINFRRQGNPSLMLRCINPAEAKLLDAATGTHIKFRLAGEKFPPNIYYKIYTHRPVVDMCANSPKDYTRADAKQATSKQVHTKGIPGSDNSEKDGWYVRIENNGWRLVSDRLIHAAMDPTSWETSKKKMEFHHDKLVRKADVEKRRRQKKIAWMHKMYKQGMLKVKVEDSETSELVKKAADGLINTVDSHGPDGVMDWEVDELLQWTTALNFDDYLEGWKETATSNISEYEVEEMLAEKPSKPDSVYDMRFEAYPTEQAARFRAMQIPSAVKNT